MSEIMLCGGDLRQISAANVLADKGYNVCFFKNARTPFLSDRVRICTEPEFENAGIVILPLPCSSDDIHLNCEFSDKPLLEEIFSCLCDRNKVYGGKLTPYIKGLADRSGVLVTDILEDEGFSIKNAYLTAEGAISVALQQSRVGLSGLNCLVIGYGRIGKCLAYLLRQMGAKVTVSARKDSDLAWIENYGYTPVQTKDVVENTHEFDIVFNTVPVRMIKAESLSHKSLYIELASTPYGVNPEEVMNSGKQFLLAASLPGKISPVAAGKIIAQTVLNLENRRGDEG